MELRSSPSTHKTKTFQQVFEQVRVLACPYLHPKLCHDHGIILNGLWYASVIFLVKVLGLLSLEILDRQGCEIRVAALGGKLF